MFLLTALPAEKKKSLDVTFAGKTQYSILVNLVVLLVHSGFMGKALAIYRIYPEENQDLKQMIDELAKIPEVKGVQREPIAFGLEVIKVGVVVDDKTGNPQEVEDKLRTIKGVKELDCLEVSLIS